MEMALAIYLSTEMSESAKIEAIRAQFLPVATMLDAMTGSSIVQDWNSDDLSIEAAFVNANWI